MTANKTQSAIITGGFWEKRVRINRESTLPIEYAQLSSTRRLDALKGTWSKSSDYTPHIFWDSDVAKWLEAAAYSLQDHPDHDLERQCDEVIADFARLQEPDGYLNSYFSQVEPEGRWTNLRDRHELYCAGHLMEAAVAYSEATGKTTLLDVMCRYADYIATVFGPGDGQKKGYPGHEEIELGLVKLYRASGIRTYLELSRYFVDARGGTPHYFDEEARERDEEPGSHASGGASPAGKPYAYMQAHLPVREQHTAEGHAVRACYLYAGMADVARETDDGGLAEACERLWKNIVEKRMYVHGGIGSCHIGERFTYDYDLPNEAAYAETCAAIALVFFAHRMFLLNKKAAYIDVLERALYNGVISGVSQDGTHFFYDNYLASHPGYHEFNRRQPAERQEWFTCSCCPTNLARMIASVDRYIFVNSGVDIWINLYAQSELTADVNGQTVRIAVDTEFPWNGTVRIRVHPEQAIRFALHLRIPGWCRDYSLTTAGKPVEHGKQDGFAVVDRQWKPGDELELTLEMPVLRVMAHPSVRQASGKVALQRGPVLYCLEEIDNGNDLSNLGLPPDAELTHSFEPDLLGGVVVVRGEGFSYSLAGWEASLYQPARSATEKRNFTAVPYYAWCNRGSGEMLVWVNSSE